MEVIAKAKYLRISPKKVNPLLRLIRKKTPKEALAILSGINKKASLYLIKLIKSAVANSKNNFNLDENKLYIAEIKADKGPVFKRVNFRARGGVDIIKKRTCHITVVLAEKEEKDEKKDKKEQKSKKREVVVNKKGAENNIKKERKPKEK